MFDYNKAFYRNIGWVTEEEQKKIATIKIAIGGLGGVGGDEIIGLARMGFQHFHIADFDSFEYSNFNRQSGATINTVGESKVDVTKKLLEEINPNIDIKCFYNGINEEEVGEFLKGVDIYVDSLDLFALHARILVFKECHKRKIVALTAAPLAMGVSFLAFTQESMSFDKYFGLKSPCRAKLNNCKDSLEGQYLIHLENFSENMIKLISGLSPTAYPRHYLQDSSKVDFFKKDLPSYKPGIDIASGTMCSNVMKVVLKRGIVIIAPRSLQFDAYLNKFKVSWRPFGYLNPLQALVRSIIKQKINMSMKWRKVKKVVSEMNDNNELHENINNKTIYRILSDL